MSFLRLRISRLRPCKVENGLILILLSHEILALHFLLYVRAEEPNMQMEQMTNASSHVCMVSVSPD